MASERRVRVGRVRFGESGLELEGASGWRQAGWGVGRSCSGAEREAESEAESRRAEVGRCGTAVPKVRARDR